MYTYPFREEEDITWTASCIGVSCLHKDEVLVIIIDVADRCYLMDGKAMENHLVVRIIRLTDWNNNIANFVVYPISIIFQDFHVVC